MTPSDVATAADDSLSEIARLLVEQAVADLPRPTTPPS